VPRNVEIKARVDDLAAVAHRAARLADGGPIDLEQDDLFFDVPRGRLKLRTLATDAGELIFYERADEAGPKTSSYSIAPTSDPESLGALLSSALGVRGRVVKRRRLYRSGATRIHLDRVEGLGEFVELEVVLDTETSADDGAATARALLRKLGIEKHQLVRGAYLDLLTD
jgi:adenylate cyclase